MKYRAEIDGLRAVAVMSVVIFHVLPYRLTGGFVGVDVFFVISGYLISKIIIGELGGEKFSLLNFYIRRALRIFPALIVVMGSTVIFGWLILTAPELNALGKHLMAGVGFVSNLAFWSESGYFDHAAESKPTLHLWSLAVEEQFYLVWPLILGLAVRKRLNFWVVFSTLGLLSLALSEWLVQTDQTAAYYSPLSRFWQLVTGAALTQLDLKRDSVSRWILNSSALCGLLLIGLSVKFFSASTPFPGVMAVIPVLGACMIIFGGPAAWSNRHVLAAKPMVWIGLISYPIYLWHWPIIVYLRTYSPGFVSLKMAAGAIFASILAGGRRIFWWKSQSASVEVAQSRHLS